MTITSPDFRARNIPELLDLVIRIYRRHFLTLIGIIALMQIPVALIQLIFQLVALSGPFFEAMQDPNFFMTSRPEDLWGPELAGGFIGLFCFVVVGFVLVQGLATAATTRAVAGSYFGHMPGIIEAYRQIRPVWLRLVLALILAALLGLVFLIWGMVPCVGWLSGLGMFIFWMTAIVPLLSPIIVLEDQTITGAIRRAWDLARRRFWGLLGFMVALFILGQVLIAVPSTIINTLFQVLVGLDPASSDMSKYLILQTIVQSLTTLGLTLIYLPLQITGITMIYFDLRIRTEGFDLAVAAETDAATSEDQTGTVEQLINQAPSPEQGGVLTWREMGYFALVSLLGGGGVVLLWAVFALLAVAIMGASGL